VRHVAAGCFREHGFGALWTRVFGMVSSTAAAGMPE